MKSDAVLKKLGLPPFKPLPLLSGAWRQTVICNYWPQRSDLPPSAFHHVDLPDGDQLLVVENRPQSWRAGDRIALLVHGLAGCYQSPYLVRVGRKLFEKGHLVLRVNLRGCGPGTSLARWAYHCGRSEDTREVVKWAARQFPDSPVSQIGFSLGANITLKMLGEDGTNLSGNLDSGIAVSAPIDLGSYPQHLNQNIRHRFFDHFFVWKLGRDLRRLQEHHDELKDYHIHMGMRLTDIDEHYTAPRAGFESAQDYYDKASSYPYLPKIATRTLILYAADDPVVAPDRYFVIEQNPNLDVVITENGGHVAFLGSTGNGLFNFRWMDEVVVRWMEQLPKRKRSLSESLSEFPVN